MEEYPDFIEFLEQEAKNKIIQKAVIRLNDVDLSREISASNDSYFLHFDHDQGSKMCTVSVWNSTNLLSTYEEMKLKEISKLTSKRFKRVIVDIICDLFGEEMIPEEVRRRITAGCTYIHNEWLNQEKGEDGENGENPAEFNPIIKTELYERYRKEILVEVEKIMASDNPMQMIIKHLDNIIAGENENKGLIFVLALSGKSKDKTKKTIVCAVEDAGAGKTWILKNISALYKSHTVSHLTKKALNYIGENINDKEILFVKELGNLDQENDDSNASIKMLSVDDGGLSTTYTLRDPETGRFITETVRTEPITILTSTTRMNLDPQFLRRNWLLSPDSSLIQTERIEVFKANHKRQEDEVLLGLREYTDMDWSLFVLKALVETIEDIKVIAPYHASIYGILDKRKTRVRGDMDKLDLLIELYGYLNHRVLPSVEMNGNKIYIMTPEKCIEIMRTARTSLVYMARDTEARVYELLQALKSIKWYDKNENLKIGVKAPTMDTSADLIDAPLQRLLGDIMSKNRTQVLRNLDILVSSGYARVIEGKQGRGKSAVYTLENNPEEIEHDLSGYQVLINPKELEKIYLNMVEEGNKELKKYGIDIEFAIDQSYINSLYEELGVERSKALPSKDTTLDKFKI